MKKQYLVQLTFEQHEHLHGLTRKGKQSARVTNRAHILLLAHQNKTDAEIAQALHLGVSTVERTRKRFVEGGLQEALSERQRPGAKPKLYDKAEAFLIATACSEPPEGHATWTMQLLADRLVQLRLVDSLSDETVRRALKKTNSSPGSKNSGASPA